MTRTPRKVTSKFQLSSAQLEQVVAALREMAPPVGARPRLAALLAVATLTLWLLMLPSVRMIAQVHHRPEGPEPFIAQLGIAWSPILLVPAVAICWASGFQARRRGLWAGALVFIAGTLPGAYYAYAAFARNEQALAVDRFTASIFDFFFTAMMLYPAVAAGAVIGFLIGRGLKLGGRARSDAFGERSPDHSL